MKCFYHPQLDAVAICKNCHKGLCADCAADLGNGVACKGHCEAEVLALLDLQQRNKTAYQKTAGSYTRLALWMGLIGCLILLGGVLSWNKGGSGGAVLGACLLAGAVIFYANGRRYRSVN
jgi:hypothetical protein